MENTVKTIKAFITSDGTLFDTEDKAVEYENEIRFKENLYLIMSPLITADVYLEFKDINTNKKRMIDILVDRITAEREVFKEFLNA